MALVLLQRSLLFANTISHDQHQSLPLPSLRWQQNRRISGAMPHRNRICIFATRDLYVFGKTTPYEEELLIVQRRRDELELLLEAHNRDAFLRSGYNKRDISYEKRWLSRLEDVIQFYHKEGRLPERAGCIKGTLEYSLAKWIFN
jgi:hypothetical protein